MKEEATISGYVFAGHKWWYVMFNGRILWRTDLKWHTNTGFDKFHFMTRYPGWQSTRAAARKLLAKYNRRSDQ